MKKIYKTLLVSLMIFAGSLSYGQITLNGCHILFADQDYTFTNVGTDTTGRNIYRTTPLTGQSCPMGSCEFQISWNVTNSRWELFSDDGQDTTLFNGVNLMYANTQASSPNPPSLTLGTWVNQTPATGCANDGFDTFTGDVQDVLNDDINHLYSSSITGEVRDNFFFEFNDISECQSSASLDVTVTNNFMSSGRAISEFDIIIDGNTVRSQQIVFGTITYDLSPYLPFQTVRINQFSGLSINTRVSYDVNLTINSPIVSAPNTGPSVANLELCPGATTAPLTATLNSSGVRLKWYTAATGGLPSDTAPTPNSSALGTTSYWVSQADINNCESIRSEIQVQVTQDTIAPVPDSTTLTDVISQCEVTTLTAPTATDNCAGIITATTNVQFPITRQETIEITWTYDDGNGNTSTQTQNVTIEDTTTPVPSVTTLPEVTAQCEVTALTAPTATDNCAGIITATTNVQFPITAQETTVVTWTYDDGNGNTTTQTQNVTIEDTTAPVITCIDDITQANDLGECDAIVNYTLPVVTDNCLIPSNDIEFIVNGDFETGDFSGWILFNSASQSFQLNDGSGTFTSAISPINGNFDLVNFQQGQGGPRIVQSIIVPENVTSANISWLDRLQNFNSIFEDPNQEFSVTLLDSELSLIQEIYSTNPGDENIQIGPNERSFDITTLLQGLEGTEVNLSIRVIGSLGSFNIFVDDVSLKISSRSLATAIQTAGLPSGSTFPIGTTTNTFSVTDAGGNTTTCSFDVTVTDSEAPVADATTLTDVTTQCEVTTLTPPTATDNCNATVTVTNDATLPISGEGTTLVTWTYDDGNGNTTTQTQNVTIEDTTAPVADLTTLTDVTAECEVMTLTAPTATDNCAGIITATTDATLPISGEGTTTIVTWTYDDGNGNTTTQTQNVTIEDTTAPVADLTTLTDVTAECEVTVLTAPTATDNCSAVITATNDATLPISTQGTTLVTWTYDDGNGNTTTQTQNVVIDDTTAPVADVTPLPDVIDTSEVTTLTPPTATDNCSATVTVTSDATLPITTPGTTVVTWIYDDGNGNTSTQTQNVIISSDNPDLDTITINGDVINNPDDNIFYTIDCNTSSDFVTIELTSVNNATFDPGATFTIDTPRPGIYTQQVTVTASNGINTRVYNITIERRFLFNDIVEQKYNNTLIVNNNFANNGGYDFVAYEWFKNGTLVSTEQFFSEGDNASDLLDPSASYSVRVTTAQGDVINTCIGTIELSNNFSLTIIENPVAQGRQLNVIADFPAVELQSAMYQIYSSSGQLIMSAPVQGVNSSIVLPQNMSVGIYRLLLVTSQRTELANFIKN